MIYITGDCHGNFNHIKTFCDKYNTTKDDILIILGDAGINYYGLKDVKLKNELKDYPITLFCIRGNHEMRPENVFGIKQKMFCTNYVFYEEEFGNILYAIDGNIYKFNDKTYIAIGGAYSVDKYYRLENHHMWFADEQLNDIEKENVLCKVKQTQYIHGVLSHTCPMRYIPTEWFLSMIDQSTVDSSMEEFLDTVHKNLDYDVWYCGHYHGEKTVDKVNFLYKSIKILQ